jgi:hypothetical protein
MSSGITKEVHWKNCYFEKLQFFTVDLCLLYFLQVKNCKFSIIFMYSNLHWIEYSYYKFSLFLRIQQKNCKNWENCKNTLFCTLSIQFDHLFSTSLVGSVVECNISKPRPHVQILLMTFFFLIKQEKI